MSPVALLINKKSFLLWAMLLGLAACGGGDGGPPHLVSIKVTPAMGSVAKGLTQQFTATGFYSNNTSAILTADIIWSAQSPAIASIDMNSGLVTALTVGSTMITVKTASGSASASAALAVTPAIVESISISPNPSQVAVGVVSTTTQLSASGTYSDGSTQDVTTTVTWASDNLSIATVASSGVISAVAIGTANISATVGSVTATAPVKVITDAWALTGSLSAAREGHTATLLADGNVLVVGGNDTASVGTFVSGKTEVYSSSSHTWTPTGSLITPRLGHVAVLLSTGTVLVAGGIDSLDGILSSSETYDPIAGVWSTAASLAVARTDHTATVLPNGKVLVVGGTGADALTLSSAEIFDPATGSWTGTGSMATARAVHTATLLSNGKVLVTGGYNGQLGKLASSEIYDPATAAWTSTGALVTARSGHTAALLKDGTVLVAAGMSTVALASVEIYDPATGSWSPTGSLNTARTFHTMSLLGNGSVLVAGGIPADSSVPIASSELFDPAGQTGAVDTWTVTGSLNVARTNATATLLNDGTVLTVGGVGVPPDPMSSLPLLGSTELFDPVAPD